MTAGVAIKHKRKVSGSFAGGDLAAGEAGIEQTTGRLAYSPDGSNVRSLDPQLSNVLTADQTVNANSTALVLNSLISVPATKLRIGSVFRWRLALSKTGAGSAARTVTVQMGTGGALADADVIAFAMPAGTAVADKGWLEVTVVCRGPLSSSGILCGNLTLIHNLSATGLAAIPCVVMQQNSAAVDVTTASLILSLAITTGASEVLTIQQCIVDTMNL